MKSRKLAEAVILQAMDDLYDEKEQAASVEFFTGEGFFHAARMSGMGYPKMLGILEIVSTIVSTALMPSLRMSMIGIRTDRRGSAGGQLRNLT